MKNKYVLWGVGCLFFVGCRQTLDVVPGDQSTNDYQEIELLGNGDKLITFPNSVRVVQRGDQYIFQGDILLSLDQFNQLTRPTPSKGAYYGGYQNRRWSEQTIYYTFDGSFTSEYQSAAIEAIRHIESRTNLVFVPRTNQYNYVRFVYIPGNVSYSYVGCQGGAQEIRISSSNSGIIMHEICHAAGMEHEHCRTDRDNYINVIYSNIQPEFRYAFDIRSSTTSVGELDFNSIMMYHSGSFAINQNQPTITKKNGAIYEYQRYYLSPGDISAVNKMYPVSKAPRFRDVYCFKYFQGDGEYTLYADVANDRSASVDWQCSTVATLCSFPYPDDGEFGQALNLYTAIEFYQPGPHTITAWATNSFGTTSHSQTFFHYDVKTTFPMLLAPNPVAKGASVALLVDPQEQQRSGTALYTVEVRNTQNQIVYQTEGSNKSLTLNVSTLDAGKYFVVVHKKGEKKSYHSILEVQ